MWTQKRKHTVWWVLKVSAETYRRRTKRWRGNFYFSHSLPSCKFSFKGKPLSCLGHLGSMSPAFTLEWFVEILKWERGINSGCQKKRVFFPFVIYYRMNCTLFRNQDESYWAHVQVCLAQEIFECLTDCISIMVLEAFVDWRCPNSLPACFGKLDVGLTWKYRVRLTCSLRRPQEVAGSSPVQGVSAESIVEMDVKNIGNLIKVLLRYFMLILVAK